ncbi:MULTISPECIES: glycoside hydrolase family 10 protein [Trichocoleus]|uniref:Family 10 glycosylhydrolase n=1 Tax=Trichocoleus desertorum GB2-A4 TaxID=2933944 RepID=A0ABV0J4A8_9CYAN|nr:glycoside hydrolase family 10 protein [Trichocoleus sp. FACHB-46]MBD1861959.1 glycoside hydrolase family 10 protein [Trichocoleus sp. FACHB-46]
MDKKFQTGLVCLLSLMLVVVLLVVPAQRPKLPAAPALTELRGVWLTNVASAVLFRPGGVKQAFKQLSQLHFNTVYPVVWNRGHTLYPSFVLKRSIGRSQDPMLTSLRLGKDVLAEMVQQGHQQGLRIIPWFEYGFMAPAGSALVQQHPDWLTSRQDGTTAIRSDWEQLALPNATKSRSPSWLEFAQQKLRQPFGISRVWLNPLHPEVQTLMVDLIVEVVTRYDVAGIQLDDHFGLPVDFGYDDFTVKLYQQEHGSKPPPDDPLDPEWMRWRANKITALMEQIFRAVKVVRPYCLITLSPNSQGFSYRTYLQDWQTWVRQGWIEELVLQVYRQRLSTFVAELKQPAVQFARQRIPVAIGIHTGSWGQPVNMQQIQEQVQAAREQGFDGVSFFYWESLWSYIAPESPQMRRQGFKTLFVAPAQPPRTNR